MIFHPLHCFASKVNTYYKTLGEVGPNPLLSPWRMGRRGASKPGALALSHFTDGETKVQRS